MIDGGKAGILVELSARYAGPASHLPLPALVTVEPGGFGGIESQLAANGSTTFAAVNGLPMMYRNDSGPTVPGGASGSRGKR